MNYSEKIRLMFLLLKFMVRLSPGCCLSCFPSLLH